MGTIYLTSLYSPLSAENQNPAPKEAHKASKTNIGRYTIVKGGVIRYQAISPKRIIKDIRKSTKLEIIALVGMIMRGK